jgi:hypothetical protein
VKPQKLKYSASVKVNFEELDLVNFGEVDHDAYNGFFHIFLKHRKTSVMTEITEQLM